MIFADKLINLRKKALLSQEELADKLGVSRQSVSKWEGAQSIPDINKIIEMSQLFGVSTDYLLKDDIEDPELIETQYEEEQPKKVTLEMTSDYLSRVEKTRLWIAFATLLCIVSPVTLLALAGVSELNKISESLMGGIGITVLIAFVAVAVVLFVISGQKLSEYEFIGKKAFETEYGVTGLVKERKKAYNDSYNRLTVSGILLCIVSVLPVFVLAFIKDGDYAVFGVCALLVLCSLGVFMIVVAGCKMGAYNKLLQEGSYKIENKRSSQVIEAISGTYWLIATAVYLLWSFLTNDWHITWIVWAIAGVLYPALMMIVKIFKKNQE